MKKPHPDSEDALELRTIQLFGEIGWKDYHEWKDGKSTLGRSNRKEVVLVSQLRKALVRLNPDLSTVAIDLAIEELTCSRSTLSLENANREIYQLLKKEQLTVS